MPPSSTVFWSGAGISHAPPTSAPLGVELTRRALAYGFLRETSPLLHFYYRALRLAHADARPRLETVLDVLVRVHGTAALVDVLRDVRDAGPNSIHAFMAAAAAEGARHVTTNFDSCLEQEGASDVLHLHGSFAEDPSGGALGATLAQVEIGLPVGRRLQMDRWLGARGEQLIVFIGYSGSDFFDVDPYLRSIATGQLDQTVVLWISHAEDDPALVEDVKDQPRQLRWLEAAGARVWHVRGRTRDVLAALARQWQLQEPLLQIGEVASWIPEMKPTKPAQERASLELYSLMGLHREVDRFFAARSPADSGEWNALAATRWSQGRKREALVAWENALDGFALVERRAAVAWVRGQYWRARRCARKALDEANALLGTGEEPSLTERLTLAETYVRIWEHMRRYPDSYFFATRRMRRYALAQLPDPAELARRGTPIGTHLISRVRDARTILGVPSEGDWESIESFGEYEALGASLNYEHGGLRQEAERGPVAPERYLRLHHDRLLIGDTSAAARMVFLPGAEAIFGWRDVVRALLELDVTCWHRCRLLLVTAWRRGVRTGAARQ